MAVQELLDATTIQTVAGARRKGRKWYFENLDLQGIKCNLTLMPKIGHGDEFGAGSRFPNISLQLLKEGDT